MAESTPGKGVWPLVVILYILLFSFPFLDIFNRTTLVFGIPLLVFYLWSLWLVFILVIFLLVRRLKGPEQNGDEESQE